MSNTLPTDAKARKNAPMDRGLLKYFPRALAYVSEVSRIGNEQHNPGQPMHWAKEKSTDHGDCIVRHQCDSGTLDADGVRHSGKVAWRALAQLEMELINEEQEAAKAAVGKGAALSTWGLVLAAVRHRKVMDGGLADGDRRCRKRPRRLGIEKLG